MSASIGMDPLSVTASIITVLGLSAKVLQYLNDVRVASKDRSKCAVEASHLHSLLLNLRFRLEEGTADNLPWYTAVRAIAVENGPLDQFKEALEMLHAGVTDGGRLKKASDALLWKFKKGDISSILGRMERLKSLIEIALQMDHFKLSQAIKDDTQAVNEHVKFVRTDVDDARHRRLLQWISPTDYPAQQSDIIKRRQEGTGQWFLDAPEFSRWLKSPKGTLFCPGIPGAGKTMVAALAIDDLLKKSVNGIVYVYCNYKAREEQDASRMLAAILKQLVQGQTSTMEHLEGLYNQHDSKGTKPSLDEIYRTLQSVLIQCPTVYLVIDALDEYYDSDGSRHQFIAKLRDLQAVRDVRIMVTSRFIPEIVDSFKGALQLEVQATKEDVKRFIAGQIYRLPRCIQRNTALQEMVQEKIVEAVDGMFLLARLHTDSLLDKRTAKDVKSTLSKLLKGSEALENAYREALQRIGDGLSGDQALAKRALSWITFAERPLTTAEICCALAIEPNKTDLDPENIPYVEDLVSVCAGLVTIDVESHIIRLVHYTTQEYFERIREKWNPSAQLQIASACITYLSFDAFKEGACPTDEDFERRLEQNNFLNYAANHWGRHAVMVQDKVYELANCFLLHDGSFSSAVQAMSVPSIRHKGDSQRYRKRTTPLHLTAYFGLSDISVKLLPMLGKDNFISANAIDSYDHTPLLLAADAGHSSMVTLLVSLGADVNALHGFNGTALKAASNGGHNQVVNILLGAGVDVNERDKLYESALQVASERGHEQVVEMLLAAGADVDGLDGFNCNALMAASKGGYDQVVKLLLGAGADVNDPGGDYGSALQVASDRGYTQVVKILLDAGADVSNVGGEYSSALQAASDGGHGQVVKLLVDAGADVNGIEGEDALYSASLNGHEQVVKVLLDAGADVNELSDSIGCALEVASHQGHEPVVKLLLDYGADVNAQSEKYGGALQAASDAGYKQVVKMLLDAGADANEVGGRCGSALYAASSKGYGQVVKLLIDAGANVDDLGGEGALYIASSRGYEQVVKILLDAGADVNERNDSDGSALEVASHQGHEPVVKLLLDYGADVNVQSKRYGSALQAASNGGHSELVKLLLDAGADVNERNESIGSALEVTSHQGHVPVVRLLLDHGTDDIAHRE